MGYVLSLFALVILLVLTAYTLFTSARHGFPATVRARSVLFLCGFLTMLGIGWILFPQAEPAWLLCLRFIVSLGAGFHLAFIAPLQYKRIKR